MNEISSGLDWRDSQHWNGGKQLPCRYCGQLTFLRDEQREPAHKVCAEQTQTTRQGGAA